MSDPSPAPPPVEELTAATVDAAHYYTPDELAAMPVDALEELWQACPERAFYENALEEALRGAYGAGQPAGDRERLEVIGRCLDYLQADPPRIPVLASAGRVQWFRVPRRVVRRLAEGTPLTNEARAPARDPLPRELLVGGAGALALGVCLLALVLRSLLAGTSLSAADLTATAVQQALVTPTPTPLALEDIDRPISGGEDLRRRYPVILEIQPAGGQARVFPVQQRGVDIAEWDYAPDPDVASAILGLVVRPALGIAYSPANETFLESLQPGDDLTLRMNTGQALRFEVARLERVPRQAVGVFDQNAPGLVVVLLADPAPDRLVVTGVYPAGQEQAAAEGAPAPGSAAPAAIGQPVERGQAGLTLTVLDAYRSGGPAGAPLPPEWVYLLVDLRLAASRPFDTGNISLALSDAAGGRYGPAAVDPSLAHLPLFSSVLLAAGQELSASVGFLVPASAGAATLSVQVGPDAPPIEVALPLRETTGSLSADVLDVILLAMETEGTPARPGDLVVHVRLFNPTSQPVTLRGGEVYAIFSPVTLDETFPVGPLTTPAGGGGLPLVLNPGQALDVEFRFDWNGEPFVGITVGGYRLVATLR